MNIKEMRIIEAVADLSDDIMDFAFQFFGQGQATCYGPVAEDIHAANERVHIESVINTAKVYALFLGRWCALTDSV